MDKKDEILEDIEKGIELGIGMYRMAESLGTTPEIIYRKILENGLHELYLNRSKPEPTKRIRKQLNKDTPEEILQLFKNTFRYDPQTGEIHRKENNRTYRGITKKGYRASLSISFKNIEYFCIYHRLCWFLHTGELVSDNMQIDHVNNIKTDNRIENLRIVSNEENELKKSKPKSNSTGYLGVSEPSRTSKDNVNRVNIYAAIIQVDKKGLKIGRFKDPMIAAHYRDSAVRYYYNETFYLNFPDQQLLPPMSVEALRLIKKLNNH